MPNVAIYPIGKDEITYFLENALRDGRKFTAASGQSVVCKVGTVFDVKWTDDFAHPVVDGNGNQTGWDKKPSELTEVVGIEIAQVSGIEWLEALKIRQQLAELTYSQIETYISNNVSDLATAKSYLITLSKVVLAIIKIMDRRWY